jgi:uncharacterized heparinase superfamily protein
MIHLLDGFAGRRRSALAGTILLSEARRLNGAFRRGLRSLSAVSYGIPTRLVIAPQDIRTADPTIAADIYAGHLVFAGTFVNAHGQSPFEVAPPTEPWSEGLHGFGWLRHLRAADTALARANARALVEDWIVHADKTWASAAWKPDVVARRLLSWTSQSPMILASMDPAFYRRFMRSVGRQTAYLQRLIAGGLSGEHRLSAAIALAEVGLCAEGMPAARRQGTRVLAEELGRQILPDGGHISRNPGVLVELLLDILPLRQAFASRGTPVPPALLNAIDRIMPAVRLFRYGDGSLALFNGMGVTRPDVLATLLTYDDMRARPMRSAPHTGYQRLEAGGTQVVCDVAKPPPRIFSERAHAGTLAFEMTVRTCRLVVNCGRPEGRNRRANEAARSTAAHSTLVVGDVSSSRFAAHALHRWLGDQIVSGPEHVEAARADAALGMSVTAGHDGYLDRFGVVHQRRLLLTNDGSRLEGEDRLIAKTDRAKAEQAYVLRFHLHPSVRAEHSGTDGAILLTLPDDDRWSFIAEDLGAKLEESIFFAAAEGPRRTMQIVVEARHPAQARINWRFERVPVSTP